MRMETLPNTRLNVDDTLHVSFSSIFHSTVFHQSVIRKALNPIPSWASGSLCVSPNTLPPWHPPYQCRLALLPPCCLSQQRLPSSPGRRRGDLHHSGACLSASVRLFFFNHLRHESVTTHGGDAPASRLALNAPRSPIAAVVVCVAPSFSPFETTGGTDGGGRGLCGASRLRRC